MKDDEITMANINDLPTCSPDCPTMSSSELEVEQKWRDLRNQAAIAAMQGTITILSSSDRHAFRNIVVESFKGDKKTYPNEIAKFAVACAESLIEELKKKRL